MRTSCTSHCASRVAAVTMLLTVAAANWSDRGALAAETDPIADIATRDSKQALPSSLGIGFLWTKQSETVAARLATNRDFVDLILGPGNIQIIQQVKPPVRVVCICQGLTRTPDRPFPGVKETVGMLKAAKVDPTRIVIGYNPERAPGTTKEELDNLLDSVKQAHGIASDYGADLLVGPGLREMGQHEHLYPELAKHCELWLIQSQRLQMDAATREGFTPEEYRPKVKTIVDRLRQGNPGIRVVVQIIAGRDSAHQRFKVGEIAAYSRAIEDLADSVRIYGGSPDLLNGVLDELRGPLPAPAVPGSRTAGKLGGGDR